MAKGVIRGRGKMAINTGEENLVFEMDGVYKDLK